MFTCWIVCVCAHVSMLYFCYFSETDSESKDEEDAEEHVL